MSKVLGLVMYVVYTGVCAQSHILGERRGRGWAHIHLHSHISVSKVSEWEYGVEALRKYMRDR